MPKASLACPFTTDSLEATHALAAHLGKRLDHGLTLALNGDLGSGKTCFVQGLAKGLDVPERYYVTSPTFNIVNVYPGRLPLFHIDLYRLGNEMRRADEEDLIDIGIEEAVVKEHVVAIEWAVMLPLDFIRIDMVVDLMIIDDTHREILITPQNRTLRTLIQEMGKTPRSCK